VGDALDLGPLAAGGLHQPGDSLADRFFKGPRRARELVDHIIPAVVKGDDIGKRAADVGGDVPAHDRTSRIQDNFPPTEFCSKLQAVGPNSFDHAA
jgi:hypothetical protein